MTTPLRNARARIGQWLVRWQEFVGWVPLMVLLVIAGYAVLGGFAPTLDADRFGLLWDLAILSAYAVAAVGVTHLAWRRWRRKLTPEEKDELWAGLMRGWKGPMLVYAINAGIWLATLLALLWFFRVVR